MKILQFNILEGCANDDARLKRIGEFITNNSYDIIGLNEAPSNIGEIATGWNYKYSQVVVKDKRKSFVAILSRQPIQLVNVYSTMFQHSMLHVNISNTHFIVTHLDSINSLLREKEVLIIRDVIENISAPLMIMGDLNSLSPLDKEFHEKNNFKDFLQRDDLLRKKFLNTAGEINYKPIEYLMESGLVDLFEKLDGNNCTVPTQFNKDIAHFAEMRLDYMLVNKHFNGDFKVRVIQDTITNSLSDHYPLECVLKK